MTTPKQNKELLGKGIRSLLQNIDADLKTTSGSLKTTVVENATGTNRISIDDIEPNPKQPRRDFEEKLIDDWLLVRKNKKASNTETALKNFINEIESRDCNINDMLQIAVSNSWSSFKHNWVDNLKNSTNGKQNSNQSKSDAEHKQSAIDSVNALFGIK